MPATGAMSVPLMPVAAISPFVIATSPVKASLTGPFIPATGAVRVASTAVAFRFPPASAMVAESVPA